MATAASPKPPESPRPQPAPAPKPGLLERILAYLPGTVAYERRKDQAVAVIEKDLIKNLRAIFPDKQADDQPGEEPFIPRIRFSDEGIKVLFVAKAARLG